jgi:hypothetical protein
MKASGLVTLGVFAAVLLGQSGVAAGGVGSPTYGDCSFNKAKHLLVARVRDEEGTLRRSGNRIVLNRPRKQCHGGRSTVGNTDRIKFVVHAIGQTTGRISLAGGPFAPGRTPEADGPEIEMTVLLKSSFAELEIDGSPGDDQIRGGKIGAGQALNLNPALEPQAPDADLFLPARNRSAVTFNTGEGSDSLDLSGGPEFEGAMGPSYVLAILGGGNDNYVGTSGTDFVLAGSGSNVVKTLEGDDAVNIRDGAPDSADCGPGEKDLVEADPFDTVVGCEQTGFVGIDD